MTLREKQSIFARNAARLIIFAFNSGMEVTLGEAHRTDEQHALNVKNGKSNAKRSKHQDRMAIDLNLFVGGFYQSDREPYKPLAKYWKSLHPDNVAGYDWGWDANHFEMK